MAKGKSNGNGKSNGRGKRRSKAEDMTGAKEAAVEVRKGELELQPIELNLDDFTLHFRAMKSAQEKMATAKSLYESCAKACKKVSEELLDSVKLALKWNGKDAADIRKTLEIQGFVLKATESSLQLTIHDGLLGDVKDAAYKRGFTAGQNGQTLISPYPASSDLDDAYRTGWRNGTSHNLGLTPEQTDAALAEHHEPAAALN